MSGGFAPQESADGRWLYYVKFDAPGLFRMPAAGGPETAVRPSLPGDSWGGWAFSSGSILYNAGKLRSLDLEAGKSRTITALPFPPALWDRSLGVSPDGRYALVTELERQGSEIHLLPAP